MCRDLMKRLCEGNTSLTSNSLLTDVCVHSQGTKIRVGVRISNLHTRPHGTTETGILLATYGTCRRLRYRMSSGTLGATDRELEELGPGIRLVDEISDKDRVGHKLQSCFLCVVCCGNSNRRRAWPQSQQLDRRPIWGDSWSRFPSDCAKTKNASKARLPVRVREKSAAVYI